MQGDTFDSSYGRVVKKCKNFGLTFIHPFDDPRVIAGQVTVGVESLHDTDCKIDYMFIGIGGGGLAAGVRTYIKGISPLTKIIGVEPEGAASMKEAFAQGEVVMLPHIDSFVDGTAVKKVGYQSQSDII
ncbi:pyridoxal-phosphate dependent enzyme [Bacillus sp. 123MFChir2]|uniref:pyridoxal-phosphate dependent enzyme n=1 Tax=Bacillus sp. 123MFChir2 TaxID=1169144 RepID=UPI00036429F2